MALKSCKSCGQSVSSSAQKCPHCGVDKPTAKVKTPTNISCRECKQQVLRSDKTCPHCGARNPAISAKKAAKGCLRVVCAFMVIIAVLWVVSLFDATSGASKDESVNSASPVTFKHETTTLEEWRNASPEDRREMIENYTAANHIPDSGVNAFYNCTSEYAHTKSDGLQLGLTLKWCLDDYNNNHNALNARINFDNFDAQFSGWDGDYKPLEAAIKDSMNDDSSYEHVNTGYNLVLYKVKSPYAVVRTTFKGTNAYGAVVKNTVSAKVDIKTGQIIEILQ
ncbi:zinc ribbon domain-containing protein [Salmonella enterica]|nr:zinc ribbon domain-containing protein [Salmonella enterica]